MQTGKWPGAHTWSALLKYHIGALRKKCRHKFGCSTDEIKSFTLKQQ